jgi:hypothetical protein
LAPLKQMLGLITLIVFLFIIGLIWYKGIPVVTIAQAIFKQPHNPHNYFKQNRDHTNIDLGQGYKLFVPTFFTQRTFIIMMFSHTEEANKYMEDPSINDTSSALRIQIKDFDFNAPLLRITPKDFNVQSIVVEMYGEDIGTKRHQYNSEQLMDLKLLSETTYEIEDSGALD